MASQGHKAKIMNKVKLCYVNLQVMRRVLVKEICRFVFVNDVELVCTI